MTTKKIYNQLVSVDMPTQEALVYTHCLEAPMQTPTKISIATGINRSTVYKLLTKLKKTGFLYEKVFSAKKYIYATDPSIAISHLQNIQKEKLNKIEKLIPSIEKGLGQYILTNNLNTKTNVHIYNGVVGVKNAIKQHINLNNNIYWIGPSKVFFKMIPPKELFQKFSSKRMDTKSLAKGITDKNFMSNTLFATGPHSFRQFKIINFPPEIDSLMAVSGNSIVHVKIVNNKPSTIVIQDKLYADMFTFSIDLLWNSLK